MSEQLVAYDLSTVYDISMTFGDALRRSPFAWNPRDREWHTTRGPRFAVTLHMMYKSPDTEWYWRGLGVCAAFRLLVAP